MLDFGTFPTKLVVKALPKVDRNRVFFRQAFRFIKQKQVGSLNRQIFKLFQTFYFAEITVKPSTRSPDAGIPFRPKEQCQRDERPFDSGPSLGFAGRLSPPRETECPPFRFAVSFLPSKLAVRQPDFDFPQIRRSTRTSGIRGGAP